MKEHLLDPLCHPVFCGRNTMHFCFRNRRWCQNKFRLYFHTNIRTNLQSFD